MSTPPEAVITDTSHSRYGHLIAVPMNKVSLTAGFWHKRLSSLHQVTIPLQFELLEETGRLDNFRRVRREVEKPYQGLVFNDSDVYKWLEAASWSLLYHPDGKLAEWIDQVITLISRAQDKDGYLNTYFSLEKVRERWMNLAEKHELYCAGHLIQAAIAHFRATGDERLMDVAVGFADLICRTFGPSQVEGVPGHPEIEMALVELYRLTGDEKYLQQASLFIQRRGYGRLGGNEYLLDHVPFHNMTQLTGHAVRALYLCCGAADLFLETGEKQLGLALERLWKTMVSQQMYVTGGVGARYEGEAFGLPYELPNARAYAETCAAIANLMWNWRMLQISADAQYADLLEWALYNAVLPGISLDGRAYFYVNPLSDDGTHRREAWFECACCPPNIARTLAALPGYLYGLSKDGIWLHQYASSSATLDLLNGQQVQLVQSTSYPWDGHVRLDILDISTHGTVEPESSPEAGMFSLFVRVPAWMGGQSALVKINGRAYRHHGAPGTYLEIHRPWKPGDSIELQLPMQVRFIESHPLVNEDYGRLALARGPLLYCLEAVDQPEIELPGIRISPSAGVECEWLPAMLGGINLLRLGGYSQGMDQDWKDHLYRDIHSHRDGSLHRRVHLKAIPYFAWANRAPAAMQVWHLSR